MHVAYVTHGSDTEESLAMGSWTKTRRGNVFSDELWVGAHREVAPSAQEWLWLALFAEA